MTEAEASDQLEAAIRAWLRASDRDDEGRDYLTGWVLSASAWVLSSAASQARCSLPDTQRHDSDVKRRGERQSAPAKH